MRRLGFLLIFAAVFLFLFPRKEEPRPRITLPAAPMKRAAHILRVVAGELDGAADATDVEEHLIGRCETVFDENVREFDFPGPDVISRPVARLAIRPVVKSLLRFANEKYHNENQEIHDAP